MHGMNDASLVYLDTNAFRDLVEGEPSISGPMQRLFEVLRKRPGLGITSELTLAEILAPSSRGQKREPPVSRTYLDLLLWSRFLSLQPVTRSILLETVRLRGTRVTAKLKLPDAIHLATAILSGCHLFVSRDRDIPMPTGMRRVEANESSVDEIIGALQ
jgi:predicted nucleic acid-binding protein